MKNTIAERVSDFLKNYPPFHFLTQEQLYTISQNVKVIYLEEHTYLFKQEERIHDHFYIVKDGAVGLFRSLNTLVDKCDEGDIFGLRALIRKSNYILDAQAIEESIVYSISSKLLEEVIQTNIEANKFLLATFATNTRNPYSNQEKGTLFANVNTLHRNTFDEVQSASFSKKPIICSIETSIKDAAIIMTNQRVGSIVVTNNDKPTGIITDKDLRTKIATGKVLIEACVADIMSSPVITYPQNISVSEAQIAMLQHKITHLCITEDGTTESNLIGILSEHDLVVLQGNNPSALIKETKRAITTDKLRDIRHKAHRYLEGYLNQNMPIFHITKVISAINRSVMQRAIQLSIEEMSKKPPVAFSWLTLGSQGRSEQLLFTDQDNALLFDDVSDNNYSETKNYFLLLSEKITTKLKQIGFEYCPAKMMANNPKWCLSLKEWKEQFNNWITVPNEDKILLSTIFFDYQIIYGHQGLTNTLSDSIFESIKRYEIFLNFLGLNAIKNPPPLSFFKHFLVEHSGIHKNQFDIKARAIMPIVDAARVLILSHAIKNQNNTILRYQKLAELEPQNKDLYESCANAFKILLRFRTQQGLSHGNSGRFIDLKSLSKLDRLKLKGCFKPIKDIQELIQVRFKLSQIL